MKIGQKLISLRNNSGKTQEQVAIDLGVSRKSIGNWEKDEREPSFDMLENLAKYYNVNIGYLFSDDESELSQDEVNDILIDRIIDNLIEAKIIKPGVAVEKMDPDDQQILLSVLNKHINERLTKHNKSEK